MQVQHGRYLRMDVTRSNLLDKPAGHIRLRGGLILLLPLAKAHFSRRIGPGIARRWLLDAAAPWLGRQARPETILRPAQPDVQRVALKVAQDRLGVVPARVKRHVSDETAQAPKSPVDAQRHIRPLRRPR